MFKVSRSGYYKWKRGQNRKREEAKSEQITKIKKAYEKGRKTYGSRRVTAQLKREGTPLSKNTVARRMQEESLKSIIVKKYKATTNSNHKYPVYENIIKDMEVTNANQAWVSDITYIPTEEGWLYLASILDLKTKEVVGYWMDDRMTKELVIKAVNRGIFRHKPGAGLILHSDRGSQYASYDYQEVLKINKFRCSMSSKGNPYENAAMESFNGTIKTELIYPHGKFKTKEEAKTAIFEYIEAFYNKERLHSSIGYMTPEEYRNKLAGLIHPNCAFKGLLQRDAQVI